MARVSVLPTYWLSMHVGYACRHSGACCSSGWAIPVEPEKVARIATLRSAEGWLRAAAEAPADVAGVLALGPDGHCVFHRSGMPSPRCEIHGGLGPAALPAACQHFPRGCLIDRRGVFVTLSHYCPTAASLLFEHSGPVAIVEGPPANLHGEAEGLDARDVLPPLLTKGVLMDLDAYSAWEALAIGSLAGQASLAAEATPEAVLDALAADATVLMKWRPGGITLSEAIHTLDRTDIGRDNMAPPDWESESQLVSMVHDSIPEEQRPAPLTRFPRDLFTVDRAREWRARAVVINRFLAAHAFASWAAYQGRGLDSMIRTLRAALAVLRYEVLRACERSAEPLSDEMLKTAIRQSDLLLVHLADRGQLAISQRDQKDRK
jgi:hypothetical protein